MTERSFSTPIQGTDHSCEHPIHIFLSFFQELDFQLGNYVFENMVGILFRACLEKFIFNLLNTRFLKMYFFQKNLVYVMKIYTFITSKV